MALLAIGLVAASVTQAAEPIFVDDGDVYGEQGLIAAINAANSTGQEVHLAANGTYVLTEVHNTTDGANGLPSITGTVTIKGNGATITRQEGATNFRIFQVAVGAELQLDAVTVSNGYASGTGYGVFGGGIFNGEH
jgi:hypothetical protein